MKFYYITVRSVTYAQRAEQLLSRQGFRCSVQRTPRWMEEQGCGYCVKLWTDDPAGAMALLREAGVPTRKIYRQGGDGALEEWGI